MLLHFIPQSRMSWKVNEADLLRRLAIVGTEAECGDGWFDRSVRLGIGVVDEL